MWTLRQTPDGWQIVDDDDQVVHSDAELLAVLASAADQPLTIDRDSIDAVTAATPPERMHWTGPICIEDEPTGDGRMMAAGSLWWETPFPLTWQREGGGHFGATVVGTVWSVERVGDEIIGTGTFDLNSPPTDEFPDGIGLEAARQVAEGITDNVSIEPDSVEAELRVRVEEVDEMEEAIEAADDGEMPPPEDPEPDEDGRILLDDFRFDDWLDVVTSARIRTLAMVTTAAFDRAVISLADGVTLEALRAGEFPPNGDTPAPDDTDEPADEPADEPDAVAAAALSIPDDPPAEWFDDPQLDGPTPLTITDDGRIFGHLAQWDTCHVGRDDICLTPPQSASDYAHFSTGAIHAACAPCAENGNQPWQSRRTGVITMGTGHAPLNMGAREALAHYDDTGYAVADIDAGEDDHGIWVAGALRPEVTPAQVRQLRASALSGDWRRIGGNLELIATLAVNVPGFPIPRSRVASGAGEQTLLPRARSDGRDTLALVAAGLLPMLARQTPAPPADTTEPPAATVVLDGRLASQLDRIESALRPQIVERMREQVHGPQRV